MRTPRLADRLFSLVTPLNADTSPYFGEKVVVSCESTHRAGFDVEENALGLSFDDLSARTVVNLDIVCDQVRRFR